MPAFSTRRTAFATFGTASTRPHSLFGTPPSFGWDAHGLLAWFYHGGGEALYRELVNDILKLNLVGFLYFPMPTQPLGWFKKEIRTAADLKDVKYPHRRAVRRPVQGNGRRRHRPAGRRHRARRWSMAPLDAAEYNNPTSDLALGLADASQFYMMGATTSRRGNSRSHQQDARFEALPAELQAILRYAAFAPRHRQLGMAYSRYPKDLGEIRKRGVSVVRTDEALLQARVERVG